MRSAVRIATTPRDPWAYPVKTSKSLGNRPVKPNTRESGATYGQEVFKLAYIAAWGVDMMAWLAGTMVTRMR